MSSIYDEYQAKIIANSEEKYRQFHISLNPGIDNILGVRSPQMKQLAKALARDNWREYFAQNEHKYFEETLLQGLAIGFLRIPLEDIMPEIRAFLPHINGWAICDSFCAGLKLARKESVAFWELIRECSESDKPYYVRFAVVMMLAHFVDDEHIDEILQQVGAISSDEYYVKMGVAWAVSVCFVKQREKTFEFLKNDCSLDKETYNKSLQKIRESFRVSAEDKELLKKIKQ